MSAVNPFTPPRAAVSDIDSTPTRFSEPKVWSASGRIGRLRYLAYLMVGYLVVILGAAVVGGIAAVAGIPALAGIAIFAAFIPYIVLSILCAIQRAHDMGWSGWTCLLTLIPFVAFIWIFKAGTPGENRFGAPPPPNTTGVKVGAWLLLAVPLIGILAAIALPAYQQYTMRAKAVQQQQQQQQAPQPQQ